MDPQYRQIIEQATKLAERSIAAFEAEKKLQEIEPKFNELSKQASEVMQKDAAKEEQFRGKVNQMADVLVLRGALEEHNKVAFVDSVLGNHEELVDVAIRLSSELKAETFGKVGEAEQIENMDAFERLALEGR
jgi:hypothetical protein